MQIDKKKYIRVTPIFPNSENVFAPLTELDELSRQIFCLTKSAVLYLLGLHSTCSPQI